MRARAHNGVIRPWKTPIAAPAERTCLENRGSPPGLTARRCPASDRRGTGTEHNISEAAPALKLAVSNGMSSACPATTGPVTRSPGTCGH